MYKTQLQILKIQNRISLLTARDPVINKNIIHKLKRQYYQLTRES